MSDIGRNEAEGDEGVACDDVLAVCVRGAVVGEEDVDVGLDVGEVRVSDNKDSCSEVMELLKVGYDECDMQFSVWRTYVFPSGIGHPVG